MSAATQYQAEVRLLQALLAERDTEIERLGRAVEQWQARFGDVQATCSRLERALDRCVKAMGTPL